MNKLIALLLSLALGCASTAEQQARASFDDYAQRVRSDSDPPKLDGSFNAYVAYAMHQSPELRADFERWRAAHEAIAVASKLPEPQITFAYFISRVETRVGPQRFKLGIRQMIPWPGVLTAAANAAASRARAEEAKLESRALALRRKVADVYWKLWLVEKEHALLVEQEELVASLNEIVRGRLQTGKADLADAAQAQLVLEKYQDHHARHRELRFALRERLRSILDAPNDAPLPVSAESPANVMPTEDAEVLTTEALRHPDVERFERMAEAAEARAELEAAKGLPSFGLGLEWIETGPAAAAVPDSGKDPLIVSLTVSVPIWFGAYSAAQRAARAEASAIRADREAFELGVRRDVRQRLSDVRDAQRRVTLHATLLVPHAETAWEATLGSYAAGRAGIAEVLRAQRELVEHQVALERTRLEHAQAWARLEELVGRQVKAAVEPSAGPSGAHHGQPDASEAARHEPIDTDASTSGDTDASAVAAGKDVAATKARPRPTRERRPASKPSTNPGTPNPSRGPSHD